MKVQFLYPYNNKKRIHRDVSNGESQNQFRVTWVLPVHAHKAHADQQGGKTHTSPRVHY